MTDWPKRPRFSRRLRRRRGVALLAAISLMVLIALMVVGGVASFAMAQRSARLAHTDAELTAAADYALQSVLSSWSSLGFADATLGISHLYEVALPDAGGLRTSVTVTRLPGGTLWLVAEAVSAGPDSGRRRVNLVARFPWVGQAPIAPIVARGGVHLDGNVVFAADTSSDPECAASAGTDVVLGAGAAVTAADSARTATLAAASDSATFFLTNRQLSVLRGTARLREVTADTAIESGALDGLMVVGGNLTITGPYSVVGLIIARGRISVPNGGLTVTGAIMSFARPSDDQPAIDVRGASIRYSKCAVERALRRVSEPLPVQKRSWAELF